MLAFDQAHGQLRVVGEDRADADQDGVVQAAQPVGQLERERPADGERTAVGCADGPVEGLRIANRDKGPSLGRRNRGDLLPEVGDLRFVGVVGMRWTVVIELLFGTLRMCRIRSTFAAR